jgi:hypothetical protein
MATPNEVLTAVRRLPDLRIILVAADGAGEAYRAPEVLVCEPKALAAHVRTLL